MLPYRALFEPVADAPFWKDSVGASGRLVNRNHFSIMFDGQRMDFEPTYANFAAAGIIFGHKDTAPDSMEAGELMRFLAHHLNHPFFASESELRSLLHASSNLELFLQTFHWHHPVYLVDSWQEDEFFDSDHIRNIEGFHILARAIASGDLTEWNNQDPSTFNTHWQSL